MTSERVLPYWYDNIAPELIDGKKVLVVAHGNSLRAIVKYLSKISDNGFFFYLISLYFIVCFFCRYYWIQYSDSCSFGLWVWRGIKLEEMVFFGIWRGIEEKNGCGEETGESINFLILIETKIISLERNYNFEQIFLVF